MSGDLLAQFLKLLDNSAGPELERLVTKAEEVGARKSDPHALEDFVAWFRGRYPVAPEPLLPQVVKAEPPNSPTLPKPTTTSAISSNIPSLWIQFDPVSQRVTHLWSPAIAAQFRDLLSQALRNRGKFIIKSGNSRQDVRSSSRNNALVDYVLTLRVDEFDHKLVPAQNALDFLKITGTSYIPKTTLTMGWGLKRSTDDSELKTDSAAASQNGSPVSAPPNKRVSTQTLAREVVWADPAVLGAVANQIAEAIDQVKVQP